MPFREHTEMKMIDVVINEKICTIHTQCVNEKGGENGNKRITRKYRNEQKGIL